MKAGKIVTTLSTLLLIVFFTTFTSAASTITLYSFASGTDGAYPVTPLVIGSDGSLYGSTQLGGDPSCNSGNGCGAIFKLSPNKDGSWTETVLYAFTGGTDGAIPNNVTLDSAGNLYSTAFGGGSGNGVVFELTPTQSGPWTYHMLYAFNGGTADGCSPMAGVVFDKSGNLYGTTVSCGANNNTGIVYELTREQNSWTETVLYNFNESTDGAFPGQLIFDNAGNLYGTNQDGLLGENNGSAFELKSGSTGWQFDVLHRFTGGKDGKHPANSVVLDSAGTVFGVAEYGGDPKCGCGVVFALKPNPSAGAQLKVLHTFENNPSGQPVGGLVFDPAGNLYGTTTTYNVLFQLAPNGQGGARFTNIVQLQGVFPAASMISDSAGKLYGTTSGGGNNYGTVFEVTP
jgi:hypothetical protein